MSRGIVLEIVDERTAVVLTNDLGYVRVPRLPGMVIGAEVDVETPWASPGRPVGKRGFFTGRRRFSWPAVAAACLIAATALTTMQVRSAWAKPYAYVSLDVNPSVELTLNSADRVVGVAVLDASSARTVQGLQLEGLTIHRALKRYVARLVAEGYMKRGRAAIIVATAPAGNGQLSSAVSADVQEAVQRTFRGANVQIASLVVPEGVLRSALSYHVSPGRLALYVEAKRMGVTVNWRDIVYGHLTRAVGGEEQLASVVKQMQGNQLLALELSRIEPQSPGAVKQSMRQLLRVVEAQAEQGAGNGEKPGDVGAGAPNRAAGKGGAAGESGTAGAAGGKSGVRGAASKPPVTAKAKVNVHIVSTQQVGGGAPASAQEGEAATKAGAAPKSADGVHAEGEVPSPPLVPGAASDHGQHGGGGADRRGLVGKGMVSAVVGGDHPTGHGGGSDKKHGDGASGKQGNGKQGGDKQGNGERGAKGGKPIPSVRVTTPGASASAGGDGKQGDNQDGGQQGHGQEGDGQQGTSEGQASRVGSGSGHEVLQQHRATRGAEGGRSVVNTGSASGVAVQASDRTGASSAADGSKTSGQSTSGKVAGSVKVTVDSATKTKHEDHTQIIQRANHTNSNGHKEDRHHKHQLSQAGQRGGGSQNPGDQKKKSKRQQKKSDQQRKKGDRQQNQGDHQQKQNGNQQQGNQQQQSGSGDGSSGSQGPRTGASVSAGSGGTDTGASVSVGSGAGQSGGDGQSSQTDTTLGTSDNSN